MTRVRLLIDIIEMKFPREEDQKQCCKDLNIGSLLGRNK